MRWRRIPKTSQFFTYTPGGGVGQKASGPHGPRCIWPPSVAALASLLIFICFLFSDFPNSELPDFQTFRLSDFQTSRLPDFQTSELSEIPDIPEVRELFAKKLCS